MLEPKSMDLDRDFKKSDLGRDCQKYFYGGGGGFFWTSSEIRDCQTYFLWRGGGLFFGRHLRSPKKS